MATRFQPLVRQPVRISWLAASEAAFVPVDRVCDPFIA